MHLSPSRTGRRAASVAVAALSATALVAATASATSAAGNMTPAVSSAASAPAVQPQLISDTQLRALTTTMGGARVLPTTRTVPHWWGSTLDPNNGVTYGYNMVGADPNNCSGSDCSVTVEADITPIIVNVGGTMLSGTDVLPATLASPQFATNDYGFTTAASNGSLARGAGGLLSQGDAGNPLQLQDATMRAQFNQAGNSSYHLLLHPNVLPAVTINVPSNQGILLQSFRGVIVADVDVTWWVAHIQSLQTKADPAHLSIYLTNNVMLYTGNNPLNCCTFGFHGVGGGRSTNSNGNAKVQAFVWASWLQPGIFARPNGGFDGLCRTSTGLATRSPSGRTTLSCTTQWSPG